MENEPVAIEVQRRWWLGRLGWAALLLAQLALFANCSSSAWVTHDLSWVTWMACGVSLPMLAVRPVLPPSFLTASARLLLMVSIALTVAGWLVFSRFTAILGDTVFITLGAFSLGFAIWLTVLGLQGAGTSVRHQHSQFHSTSSLDGKLLAGVLRRPVVWLALVMVGLVSAGVFHVASSWPLVFESSPGRVAVLLMGCFWLGGMLGGARVLSRLESKFVHPLMPLLALAAAAGVTAALPFWLAFLACGPALVLGYAWMRVVRDARQLLRAELSRSLQNRVASWLLGWAGAGGLLAALLAFSLLRGAPTDTLDGWLRGALPALLLLLGGMVVAWLLRAAPRAEARLDAGLSESGSTMARWLDFPGLELAPPQQLEHDPVVVEIAYDVPEDNRQAFFQAMAEMESIRFEEGALWWTLTENDSHETVFHEFFQLESWTAYREVIKEESGRARTLKQQVFAANNWETMPAEIHYPVLGSESIMARAAVEAGDAADDPAAGKGDDADDGDDDEEGSGA